MLYDDKPLGRDSLFSRLGARFMRPPRARRATDLDLLNLSPHLRRDLGLEGGIPRRK